MTIIFMIFLGLGIALVFLFAAAVWIDFFCKLNDKEFRDEEHMLMHITGAMTISGGFGIVLLALSVLSNFYGGGNTIEGICIQEIGAENAQQCKEMILELIRQGDFYTQRDN